MLLHFFFYFLLSNCFSDFDLIFESKLAAIFFSQKLFLFDKYPCCCSNRSIQVIQIVIHSFIQSKTFEREITLRGRTIMPIWGKKEKTYDKQKRTERVFLISLSLSLIYSLGSPATMEDSMPHSSVPRLMRK
jgi:hypothetical protein